PSGFVKIVWGDSLSAIAYVLLLAGGVTGLDALQSAAIISALPFSFVIILMVIEFYKDANGDRKYLGMTITQNKRCYKEYIDSFENEKIDSSKKETYYDNVPI